MALAKRRIRTEAGIVEMIVADFVVRQVLTYEHVIDQYEEVCTEWQVDWVRRHKNVAARLSMLSMTVINITTQQRFLLIYK